MTISDRDELARAVRPVLSEYGAWGTVPPEHPVGVPAWGDSLASEYSDCPESIADALWAAGWRKKPSAAELVLVLVETKGLSYGERAEAVLALMDGPTETGEVVSDVRRGLGATRSRGRF